MPDPKDTSKTQRIKKILWESNINTPIRGIYNLMNTPYEDLMGPDSPRKRKAVEDSFDVAASVTGGSAFAPKPKGSLTMGANRGKAPRSPTGAKMTSGRQKLMDKLETSRQAGAKARNTPKEGSKGRSGTLSERLEATRARPRTKKESEKFGPLVKREENLPAKQSRAVVKREDKLPAKRAEESRAVVKREDRMPATQGSRSVATQGTRTFADKGSGSRLGTNLKRGAAAIGVGAATYGLYKGADKPSARQKESPRDDRASSLSSKSEKAAAFKAKQQGMKSKGSPTNPSTPKKAGDKSRMANKPEKKFSNFERMKQRQYEKEGFGGRSMTSSKAKERVKTERGFKFKDLFKKK